MLRSSSGVAVVQLNCRSLSSSPYPSSTITRIPLLELQKMGNYNDSFYEQKGHPTRPCHPNNDAFTEASTIASSHPNRHQWLCAQWVSCRAARRKFTDQRVCSVNGWFRSRPRFPVTVQLAPEAGAAPLRQRPSRPCTARIKVSIEGHKSRPDRV